MFEITEETKAAAVAEMRDILSGEDLTDEKLGEAFDAAVTVVKKQFGF